MKSGRMLLLLLGGILLTTAITLADTTFVPNCNDVQNNRIQDLRWGAGVTDDSVNRQNNHQQYGDPRFGYSLPVLPTCETPSDNTRGTYTSDLSPCEFTFHKVDQPKKGNADGSSFGHLPTVCAENNKIELSKMSKDLTILHYLYGWKDECVGNFPRCYSLSNHQDIYLALICRKKLTIPEGATHIRVNCAKDIQLKTDIITKSKNSSSAGYVDHIVAAQDKELHAHNTRWSEMRSFATFLISVLVLLCIGCSLFSYLCIFRPYLALSRETSSELKDLIQRSELEEMAASQGDGKVRRRGGGALVPNEP